MFRTPIEKRTPGWKEPAGWEKVKGACAHARKYYWEWIWIDSCGIDKSSSAELSENINPMYRLYENAGVSYVYLSDASSEEDPGDPGSIGRTRTDEFRTTRDNISICHVILINAPLLLDVLCVTCPSFKLALTSRRPTDLALRCSVLATFTSFGCSWTPSLDFALAYRFSFALFGFTNMFIYSAFVSFWCFRSSLLGFAAGSLNPHDAVLPFVSTASNYHLRPRLFSLPPRTCAHALYLRVQLRNVQSSTNYLHILQAPSDADIHRCWTRPSLNLGIAAHHVYRCAESLVGARAQGLHHPRPFHYSPLLTTPTTTPLTSAQGESWLMVLPSLLGQMHWTAFLLRKPLNPFPSLPLFRARKSADTSYTNFVCFIIFNEIRTPYSQRVDFEHIIAPTIRQMERTNSI
ncbi:hypothetical protein K435DRAFT_856817 [Dendrothele bispora CBS 962.96]|uniref:Heterokaryon incompatibility domain-containing protein n=1 Tax=Dendrothele bispora (strain CBS 962.96) TaxID=1314807 RepID=A0A4S8M863_DENBC|nr:hypothetical protein K435DRAFT_856817 [Dendrothele bispora CBS 962.96]